MRLTKLEENWLEFLAAGDYFNRKYFQDIKTLVAAYTEMLSNAVFEITGNDPQYNIIDRPYGYATQAIYTADGTARPLGTPPQGGSPV